MTELPTGTQPLLLTGHILDVLRTLPKKSVQAVVTSPPYYWARNYGTEPVIWLASATSKAPPHEHQFPPPKKVHRGGIATRPSEVRPGRDLTGQNSMRDIDTGSFCTVCASWRGSLGHEPTVDLYAKHVADVLDEVRPVLRDDGTVWLNIGDGYDDDRNLIGAPWRVAFELEARGWIRRAAIFWLKPNTMESAKNRPTRAYELVFLLAKGPKYFYDSDAERRTLAESSILRMEQSTFWEQTGGPKDYGTTGTNPNRSARKALENLAARSGYSDSMLQEILDGYDGEATRDYEGTGAQDPSDLKKNVIESGRKRIENGLPPGANLRDWWLFPTYPSKFEHFATFPPELPRRCIVLGTSEKGACPKCGSPYSRIVEREPSVPMRKNYHGKGNVPRHMMGADRPGGFYPDPGVQLGWSSICDCNAGTPVPCVVLDIFSGSGTTLAVARELGRRSIGIDLNPEYKEIAEERPEVSEAAMAEEW